MKEGFKVFQDKTGKIHFGTNKNKKGRGKAKTKGKNVTVKQEGKTEQQEPEEAIPRQVPHGSSSPQVAENDCVSNTLQIKSETEFSSVESNIDMAGGFAEEQMMGVAQKSSNYALAENEQMGQEVTPVLLTKIPQNAGGLAQEQLGISQENSNCDLAENERMGQEVIPVLLTKIPQNVYQGNDIGIDPTITIKVESDLDYESMDIKEETGPSTSTDTTPYNSLPNGPLSCIFCGEVFDSIDAVLEHTRTSHASSQQYECNECEKMFKYKSQLVFHKKEHRGHRSYRCEQCNRIFVCKAHMINHMRMHTGEKPFSCDQCDKKFSYRSNLVKHAKTHMEDRPYSCSKCGKTFAEAEELIEHRKTKCR